MILFRYEANDPFVQELIVKLDELLTTFKVGPVCPVPNIEELEKEKKA